MTIKRFPTIVPLPRKAFMNDHFTFRSYSKESRLRRLREGLARLAVWGFIGVLGAGFWILVYVLVGNLVLG